MEQQKLPNSTLILVFGIVSIVTCCCYGIIGLIFGIIAIVLAKKATVVYLENPEQYTGYSNVKTGKILAIIGIILNLLYLIYVIWLFATIGMSGVMNMRQDLMDQYGL
ncbi:MAG: CCC motif membrane protein [Bacteroidetes bacterium]|nr:CCC motif membrane protein [Bacteroidota bacterium]